MKSERLWSCGLLLLVAVAGLLPSAGCRRAGRLDDKERGNRIVMKAYEMVDQGDYAAAVALFNKVLETYPEMARPHLDLAILLHERRKDYMRAIYHYHRYLELRPDTEKEKMILERIRQAEQTFVSQRVTVGGADGRSALDLMEENRVLQTQLQDARGSVFELRTEINLLREADRQRTRAGVLGGDTGSAAVSSAIPASPDVTRSLSPENGVATSSNDAPLAVESVPLQVQEPRPEPPVTVVEPKIPAARPVPPASLPAPSMPAARPVPSSGIDRTYTVQRGDSLSKIAFKVYGDATQWRTIQDANQASLGDSVNVRVGQVLVIP